MRITTKMTISMLTGEVLEHEYFEYQGPVALCDRAAQGAAKSAGATAATTAGQLGSEAQGALGAVQPFYTQEINARHGFNPTQTNEMLTAAAAGAGGATGALQGRAEQEAVRTRNASGFTKSLDEAARDRAKAAASTSEGIAAEDVQTALARQQAGAAGEQGLFGTTQSGELNAMGQRTADINAQLEAGRSGWLQNMAQTLKALKG